MQEQLDRIEDFLLLVMMLTVAAADTHFWATLGVIGVWSVIIGARFFARQWAADRTERSTR